MRKFPKIENFKAWCSGKAYNRPDECAFDNSTKTIRLYTHDVHLASFSFETEEEYKAAITIAIQSLKRELNER